MGEVIDLESYRRQRKRRPIETRAVGTNAAANRRGRNRGRSEHDRLRPAVEPLDRGRGSVDPAAEGEPTDVEPGDKPVD